MTKFANYFFIIFFTSLLFILPFCNFVVQEPSIYKGFANQYNILIVLFSCFVISFGLFSTVITKKTNKKYRGNILLLPFTLFLAPILYHSYTSENYATTPILLIIAIFLSYKTLDQNIISSSFKKLLGLLLQSSGIIYSSLFLLNIQCGFLPTNELLITYTTIISIFSISFFNIKKTKLKATLDTLSIATTVSCAFVMNSPICVIIPTISFVILFLLKLAQKKQLISTLLFLGTITLIYHFYTLDAHSVLNSNIFGLIDMVNENPILGTGENTYRNTLLTNFALKYPNELPSYSDEGNIFIKCLIEFGIVGLIGLISLVGSFIYLLFNNKENIISNLSKISVIVPYIILGITNQQYSTSYILLFIIPILFYFANNNETEKEQTRDVVFKISFSILIFATSITFTFFGFKAISLINDPLNQKDITEIYFNNKYINIFSPNNKIDEEININNATRAYNLGMDLIMLEALENLDIMAKYSTNYELYDILTKYNTFMIGNQRAMELYPKDYRLEAKKSAQISSYLKNIPQIYTQN